MSKVQFNYQLANTAGYRFEICKIGSNVYDKLAYYQKENFPDVELTRPSVNSDLSLLDTKCLMSVNGYIYPTRFIDGRLYIPNATTSMLKSRANHIGILSFNKLTKPLVKHVITPAMVTGETNIPLFEKTILTFNEPIGHAILSVCGYLIFEHPEYFYRVSDRSFVLRLDRLNYIEKLYELDVYSDIFKRLAIPVSTTNPNMIDSVVAKADSTIINFLTQFNSFLTEVPVKTLDLKKVYLERSNIPGNFRTEIEPTMPIVVGYGKLAEYFKKKTNDTKYNVYITDAHYNQYLISSSSLTTINIHNNNRIPGNTYRLTHGYFLDMSATIA